MLAKDITDGHLALQLFPGYADADLAVFAEFANPEAKPEAGFVVDFLGSRIRASSLWKEAQAFEGQLLGLPVPADFHAESIEWIGLLKSVRAADREYVAMELGAGFGPWIVAGGVAARRKGIRNIRLYAVEGDPQRFGSLSQHLADNGFDPHQHALFNAAVGTNAGTARWPVIEDSLQNSGCRPILGSRDYMGREFECTMQVKVIPMLDLVVREPRWDLIHLDVQGQEVDICRSCIKELSARVKWLVAATHSRKIDGDFLELMSSAGWILEHEKPSRFIFAPNSPTLEAMTTIDGTQVWRNPDLVAASGKGLMSFSQEITSPLRELQIRVGDTYILEIVTKNTGSESWFSGGGPLSVNASYRWLQSGAVLPIEGKRSLLSRGVLHPGESEPLHLRVMAPSSPGSYGLRVSMVQEGVAWFHDRGATSLTLRVTVT